MLENVGLGGVLSFDHKAAVTGMREAGAAAEKFSGQFNGITNVAKAVGGGLQSVAGAFGSLSIATLPATAIFGAGTAIAVDFQKQMSAVGAVSGATAEEMAQLTKVAKEQGASTAFSATEAGQGLELLALGGFSAQESIAALPSVLSAAAADGIELAQAADVVSNTLKALDLDTAQASHVSDVLAMTAGKTSTSILLMGESMKYAAPEARTLGIDLETTSGLLGLIADAGLKGSAGGTALTSALVKLAKPSKQGAEYLQQLGISMTKTKDGGLDIVDVFKQLDEKTKGVSDVMERARIVNEIFGERGSKAFTSIQTAIKSGKINTLIDELRTASGKFGENLEYDGYAAMMAAKRLDNFAGAMDQLKGAMEGFALETAARFLEPAKESIQMYGDIISDLVLVLQELNSEEGLTGETADKAGTTIVAVAKGIKEGIDLVIDAWRMARMEITMLIERFSGQQSPEMIQQFTKIATVMFVVAAAATPILAAIAGIALFISSVVVPVFTGLASIVGAVFSGPVLLGIGAAVGAFMLLRDEGESVGQTFQRITDNIVAGFNWVMETAITPFIAGIQWGIGDVFTYIGEQVMDFFHSMHDTFANLIGAIMHIAQTLKPFFEVLFTFIGNIVGVVAAGIGLAFTSAMWVVQGAVKAVATVITAIIDGVAYAIRAVSMLVGFVAESADESHTDIRAWGEKARKWGQSDFEPGVPGQVTVDGKKSPTKTITESGISAAELLELDKQAKADAMAMQVGQAVADNMPKNINVESKVCVDGKTIAKATAKHQQEIHERAGFKATPWQRRAAVEHGATQVGA